MRWLAASALCLMAWPAAADMFQDAKNASQPAALQNLTNQILTLSGGVLKAGTGSGAVYGTSSPTVLDILKGTDASPITAAGQQIRIVYRQNVTNDKCGNNSADTGCTSPLLINAIGSATNTMVVSGITAYAETSGTGGSDAQPLNGIAIAKGDSPQTAMGAFLIGYLRTTTGTGRSMGAEISATNDTGFNVCTINTGLLGRCDGIWLAARARFANTPLDSALHIGSADVFTGGFGSWKEAITVNTNAIYGSLSAGTKTFGDYSTSETSLYIGGSHRYSLATGATSGLAGFGTLAPGARLHLAGGFGHNSWASTGIALRVDGATYTDTTSSGVVGYTTAVSAFSTPTIAATNPTTYDSMSTVYIGGCPIAGTNVTTPSCLSLTVAENTYFGGRMEVVGDLVAHGDIVAAGLDTGGTIAGSLCRTAAGLFVYKAGANCF